METYKELEPNRNLLEFRVYCSVQLGLCPDWWVEAAPAFAKFFLAELCAAQDVMLPLVSALWRMV